MVLWSGVHSLLFGEVVLVWYLVDFGFVTGFSMIVSAVEAMSLEDCLIGGNVFETLQLKGVQ
jgi:hypothetical protein